MYINFKYFKNQSTENEYVMDRPESNVFDLSKCLWSVPYNGIVDETDFLITRTGYGLALCAVVSVTPEPQGKAMPSNRLLSVIPSPAVYKARKTKERKRQLKREIEKRIEDAAFINNAKTLAQSDEALGALVHEFEVL